MSIALRGTPVSNNARSTSVSVSFTVAAGDFLVCAVASSSGSTINTPTGGGGTWVPIGSGPATNGSTAVRLFYNASPTAGTATISATTNTGRDSEICVAAFTGAKTASPVDATANGTGLSINLTTLTANDVIIVASGGANNAAYTAGTIGGTAATLLTNQSGVANADQGAMGMEYRVVTTAQAYTCTFSAGAATQAIQAVALLDGGSGANGTATITGAAASSSAGTLIAGADASIPVLGLQAATAVGAAVASVDEAAAVSGIAVTSAGGTLTTTADGRAPPAGVAATAFAGSLSGATATIFGQSTAASVGQLKEVITSSGGAATPTLVQHAVGGTSVSFPAPTTAGNLIIVTVRLFQNGGGATWTGSVSDGVNSYTRDLGMETNTQFQVDLLETFYCANAASASTVTVSNTTGVVKEVFISEWSGIATTTPHDTSAAPGGTSSVTLTLAQAGELFYSIDFQNPANEPTVGAGFTAIDALSADASGITKTAYKVELASGSNTVTWTQNGASSFTSAAAAFKPAAGGTDATIYIDFGVQAVASAGSVVAGQTSSGDASATVTGVSATSAVGSLAAAGDAVEAIIGQDISSAVGALTVTGTGTAILNGQQGVSGAGALNSSGSASVASTGVSAASASGSLTEAAFANATLNGTSATSAFGSLSESGTAIVNLIGVSVAALAGTVTASQTGGPGQAVVVGQQAASAVGTFVAIANADVAPSGIAAVAQVGTVFSSVSVATALVGAFTSSATGTLVATGNADEVLGGQGSSASVGILDFQTDNTISILGVSAQALAGTVVAATGQTDLLPLPTASFTRSVKTPSCSFSRSVSRTADFSKNIERVAELL